MHDAPGLAEFFQLAGDHSRLELEVHLLRRWLVVLTAVGIAPEYKDPDVLCSPPPPPLARSLACSLALLSLSAPLLSLFLFFSLRTFTMASTDVAAHPHWPR